MNISELMIELMDTQAFAEAYYRLEPHKQLAMAVIRARIQNGWSQQQLSVRSGVARNTISAIEHMAANPTLETMQNLAKALGLKLTLTLEVELEPI